MLSSFKPVCTEVYLFDLSVFCEFKLFLFSYHKRYYPRGFLGNENTVGILDLIRGKFLQTVANPA